ncbi:MAG: hypothetical protein IPL65_17975 [Lewinellaceae bacterium]|nr:hypothetical protein [Lewinellaceae bacterium]
MHLSFRPLLSLFLLLLLSSSSLFSQDCASVMTDNKKIGGVQFISTNNLTIVVRARYSYQMQIFANEKGIFGRMTSIGGIEFNQDDQVLFADANGVERSYRFVNMDEVLPGSVPSHRNILQLDKEAVEWLSISTIGYVTYINFVSRQKHKFEVSPNRQVDLNKMAGCFLAALDPNYLLDGPRAAVSNTKTSQGGDGTAATTNKPANNVNNDKEVKDLRAELDKTKASLKAEIEAEKAKSDAIKAQLQQEVAEAREAAAQKKKEYADEVVAARKSSLDEIEKAKAEVQNFISSSKTKADSAVAKLNIDVEAARKSAGEEITKARQVSADEVQKHGIMQQRNWLRSRIN